MIRRINYLRDNGVISFEKVSRDAIRAKREEKWSSLTRVCLFFTGWGYECVQTCTWNEKLPSSDTCIYKKKESYQPKIYFRGTNEPFSLFSTERIFFSPLLPKRVRQLDEYILPRWTNIFEIFERYSGEGKSRRIIGEDGRPRFQIFGEIEMTNRYISGVRFHWRRSTIGLSIRRRIDRIRSSIVNRDGNFPSMENGSFISRILWGKGGAGWKRLTSYIAACIIKLFVICF